MKFNKWILWVVYLSGILFPQISSAIEVFPIIKEIRESTPRDNFITVKSMYQKEDTAGEERSSSQIYEFVTLELFYVPNPGDEKEKRIKELGSKDPFLVFSPTKLIIPYGEERKVRIMTLKPVEKERVYRLRVRPSYPEQELDKAKVRFAIGYDILLRYLPEGNKTQEISVDCNNNKWTLTATGNVRSELKEVIIDGRKAHSQFNVYPGNSRTLTVNKLLAFEMENKTVVYEGCRKKE